MSFSGSCSAKYIPIIILLFSVSQPAFSQPDTDDIVIMIADFEGPDPEEIPVTESFYSWFQQTGAEDGTFSVVRLNQSIEAGETFQETLEQLQQYGADLVVYGVYDLPGTHVRVVVSVASTTGATAGQLMHIHFDVDNAFPLSELIPGSDPSERVRFLIDILTGYVYLSRDDFENALQYIDRSLERESSASHNLVALAYSLRGVVSMMLQGDALAALDDAERAIELDSGNYVHYTYRGGTLEMMGEIEAALDDYLTVNELDPSNPENLYNMSRMYRELGDYNSAIDCITTAILMVPDEQCYLNARGYIYNYLQDYVSAIDDISRALEIDPTYPTGWANLGCAHRGLGNIAEAIECFTNAEAYQQDPALDGSYYIDRGYCYSLLEDYESAISDYVSGTACSQRRPSDYAHLGWMQTQQEDFESAILSFDHALQLDADNPKYLSSRGYCYYMIHEREAAIRDFTGSIRLDPDGFDNYEFLGKAYADEGYLDAAADCFSVGFERASDPHEKAWYLSYRARCFEMAGDLESASMDLHEAVQLHPSEAYLHFRLGEIYYLLDREYEAIECYNEAIERGLTTDYLTGCLFQRGRSHLIVSNSEQAIQDLTTTLEYNPGYYDAYYFRGLAYLINDDLDPGREDIEYYILVGTDPFLLSRARQYLEQLEEQGLLR